jgi:triosephosphate isomerase
MRENIIAGNWKMNTTLAEARALARGVAAGLKPSSAATVVLCPPFVSIESAQTAVAGTQIRLGAQNVYYEDDGAFTGEVSASMLKSMGCEFVILGHSERRQLFGETDESVNKRFLQCIKYGLRPIFCVGETLEERDRHETLNVIRFQVGGVRSNLPESDLRGVVIAYEPVWAIGTGRTASPEQAQEIHAFIRDTISVLYSQELADTMPIIYGGSVKPENAAAIFSQPDIDGGLIGGASLKAEQFLSIIAACPK